MTKQEKRILKYAELFRVNPGSKVTLADDFDPGFTADAVRKKDAQPTLRRGVALLADYQARLAAQDTYGVLVLIQALDAGGKDGTIRHVMSGVNPQGVRVHSFKVPSAEELNHDFLWRYAQRLPARGEIGIFNRSYYEEVLVVRVHPENLTRQKLPAKSKRGRRMGAAPPGDQRLGALSDRQRHQGRQALPEPLEGGAADPVPEAARPAGAELEVLRARREGAGALGRLSGGVLADALAHQHELGAVACHPGRPQVVRPARRRGGDRERADRDRPAVSAGGRGRPATSSQPPGPTSSPRRRRAPSRIRSRPSWRATGCARRRSRTRRTPRWSPQGSSRRADAK